MLLADLKRCEILGCLSNLTSYGNESSISYIRMLAESLRARTVRLCCIDFRFQRTQGLRINGLLTQWLMPHLCYM